MKWDRAIIQHGPEVGAFVAGFLGRPDRRCVLICGAGFDPRTLALPQLLVNGHAPKVPALCLREERPKPQPSLRPIANGHEAELRRMFASCTVSSVRIFDDGGSVVGGRRVVQEIEAFLSSAQRTGPLTDVIVDISALSCGIFFPIIAYLLSRIDREKLPWNLHLFVTENPQIDIKIRGELTDAVSHIHGFQSPGSLSQTIDHAMLWAPVLAEDNEAQMRRIHSLINQPAATVDISPIVPFPGIDPRRPDTLVEEYRDLIGEWEVDPRHFLYAGESDPLDSYRSICEVDQLREETYGQLGGSSTIVSPLGSKMLSVGLMLAAIERRLRVLYVECLGYEELAVPSAKTSLIKEMPITHIWIHGDIYRGWP
jgi:hypothetical protein